MNKPHQIRFPLKPAVALVLGAHAMVAWAQAVPVAEPSTAPSSLPPGGQVLPEVRVKDTTRRPNPPSALTSTARVTGQQAEELGLRDLREALKLMGNVYTAPSNNGNNGITIRGMNSEGVGEPGANSRPLTTLVIDGAAQSVEGVRRGQRGNWDIRDIEVLRGPQSTLQGRNTMAGSIVVRTNDPTDHWEGAARLNAGERDVIGPAVMLSGPLGQEWAFRFAAETAKGNKGISYSSPAASHLDDDEYRNVRTRLRYRPQSVPGLEVKFTVSDTTDDPSVTAISLRRPTTPPRNDGCPNQITADDRYFCVTETAAERRRNKVRNHVADVSYQLSPGIVFSSITAYIETDALIEGTGAFKGLPYVRDEVRSDADTTQLFRYAYAPEGSAWTGQAGAFFGRFTNDRDSFVTVGPNVQQDLSAYRREINAAIFGEARWGFRPDWKLVMSARYEREVARQTAEFRTAGTRERSKYDGEAFLPAVGVLRELTPTQTVGFNVSTGYRGGLREIEADTGGRDVDPEFLTNYELTYRSKWLEGKVTFDANVFYSRLRDQQVAVNKSSVSAGTPGDTGSATVLTTTLNAGSSHRAGAEADLSWRVARRVVVGASLGLLRTRFDDFQFGDQNLRGNEFPEAPHLSGSVWATARIGTGWFVSGNVSARSGAFATSDIFNDDSKRIPGYSVVGMRFGYEGDHLSTIFWIDNLTDRVHLTGRDFRDGSYVGDPRRAGVTVTARF